ncbi:MAG: hypothetical protein JWQ72_467, partial [Polaromonas sp.]|nr:hypothetical protein [Polaromonas sp.]
SLSARVWWLGESGPEATAASLWARTLSAPV